MYACIGKNIVHIGFSTSYGFKHPLGVLEPIPVDRRDYCISFWGTGILPCSPRIPNAYPLQAPDKHGRSHDPLMSQLALASPWCRQTTRNTFP